MLKSTEHTIRNPETSVEISSKLPNNGSKIAASDRSSRIICFKLVSSTTLPVRDICTYHHHREERLKSIRGRVREHIIDVCLGDDVTVAVEQSQDDNQDGDRMAKTTNDVTQHLERVRKKCSAFEQGRYVSDRSEDMTRNAVKKR